ncbi:hypothetical protein J2X02_000973 [Pseudoxanthomonas japonensis]|jgi:hypothetical protein|nr:MULTISPECIES: hypothetical protein [Pseudoxanthomonas]MDR7068156.1 hypothetical protein [Pseudoxanthomonas japonensis]
MASIIASRHCVFSRARCVAVATTILRVHHEGACEGSEYRQGNSG